MNTALLLVIGCQILFTLSDLLARMNMPSQGFKVATFLSGWFLTYFLLRTVAMFGQLYIFANLELGKTVVLFGAASILLSNLLGFFVLQEVLSTGAYIAMSLVIMAFIVLAFY
jgi:uncharacterized membrane protein